ncbi:hypothetical protein RND81_12G191800 [Saponaria officinalis]|uniref:Uncharacterized protein n=1 Tax=Saponaria officinalis TaxID=3572 RepID=A0AAW1HCM6_SAPOF
MKLIIENRGSVIEWIELLPEMETNIQLRMTHRPAYIETTFGIIALVLFLRDWFEEDLMGSFVPFGGFFPTPSDFRAPLAGMRAPFTRCNECNVSYEKELRATPKEGSSVSVAGDQSSTLPSWLQSAEADPSKAREVVAQVSNSFLSA